MGAPAILAATDFTPLSAPVAGRAAALAMAARLAPEAELHAVQALRLPLVAAVTGGSVAADDALTQAEAMRAGFLARPDVPPLAEPPELVPGPVHLVLEDRLGELEADLVAIGTHSGSAPEVLGNCARDLMRAPPTDLLIAKPA